MAPGKDLYLDISKTLNSYLEEKDQPATYIDLNSNRFVGTLPTTIGFFSHHLTHLDLGSNDISGHIPSEIGLLKKLAYLNLAGNDILSAQLLVYICSCWKFFVRC